jgi:beta-phosphoglucomutase-like phosphatase (HAD superfamily)
VLGLPDEVRACLFDLDGVLTETAEVHAAAWKDVFDEFLRGYPAATQDSRPFDVHSDYEDYVDGKTRLDGVRDFSHGADRVVKDLSELMSRGPE